MLHAYGKGLSDDSSSTEKKNFNCINLFELNYVSSKIAGFTPVLIEFDVGV